MPEYLSPGVYIEEVLLKGKPIEGVSTSTVGLVGRAQTGPVGEPTLVTSYLDFLRTFGDPLPAPSPDQLGDYLGHAVLGFFNNGGKRAWIVRVLGPGAATAATTLTHGVVARLKGPAPSLTAPLKLESLRGLEVGEMLAIYRRGASGAFASIGRAAVAGYDASMNTVRLSGTPPVAGPFDPGSIYFVRELLPPALGADASKTPTFQARDAGAGGNRLRVQLSSVDQQALNLAVPQTLRARLPLGSIDGGGGSATSLALAEREARLVRIGDLLRFDAGSLSTTRPVTSLAPVEVELTADQPIPRATLGAHPIRLVQRGSLVVAGAVLAANGPSVDIAAAAAERVALPQSLAALLQAGDVITAGEPAVRVHIDAVHFPEATLAGFASLPAAGFDRCTVTLTTTADRLLVADPTLPLAPGERVAIVGPDGPSAATVRWAQAETVLLADPLDPAIAEGWQRLERLQIVAAGAATLTVPATSGFYTGALLQIDDGEHPQYALVRAIDADTKTLTLDGPLARAVLDSDPARRRSQVRILELEARIWVGDEDRPSETFPRLTWNPDPGAQSHANYYVTRINATVGGSRLVTVTPPVAALTGALDEQPTTGNGLPQPLSGGDDGAAPTAGDIIGADRGPGRRSGIHALQERDDISLVAVPGVSDLEVQAALLNHCELLKYRFAVLDAPLGSGDIPQLQAHRNHFDSQLGAYYAPWLLSNGSLVPPSGHVLGIYARTDVERGVHKAPANEVVRSVLDLELRFSTGEQDILNPAGINLLRDLTPRSIRVWGARTLSSDPDWKYVNVRRLFLFLEKSIDIGTQWVVFEPNNEALWARVVESVTSFLFGVWKSGALMGTKPEDAFFVRCDRTTMTQDDIDNGRLVCLIGVAPSMPAEFVVFRIGQITAGQS